MTADRERQQLEDAWALVDQLGELSLRLKLAAIAASKSLGLLAYQEDPDDADPEA